MKKIILLAVTVLSSVCAMAQSQLAFPFQGGAPVMTTFFKDSVVVSPEIIKAVATGTAIFKFSANEKGAITRIVICYADDYILAVPIIEALKKSNHKWIIPDHEKVHDFVLPFSIKLAMPANAGSGLGQQMLDFYIHRKPIATDNQIPLDNATLLPTVNISYEIGQ